MVKKLFLYLDHLFDKVYTAKYNPLYQSGVLAVFLLGLVIVTGTYLVFFYKISAPYESVQNIQNQIWAGHWIRALHRYAADLTIVAVFFHVLRMLIQNRSWGVRTLAWISGIFLTGIVFFCGITGFMMVWDQQGQFMATALARMLDQLPIFSEPLARAFQSSESLPRSFFFLNLFMHVSLPLGIAFIFWLHTAKVARPALKPPRGVMIGTIIALLVLSIFWGVSLPEKADPLAISGIIPSDLFYGFWIPAALYLSPLNHTLIWIAGIALLTIIPWITKPKAEKRLPPSFVHEKSCTGCNSCYKYCPFDAISMVPRTIGHGSAEVAKVNPLRCISCGICSAACDPMGVGPAGRTGRDQLKDIEHFFGTLKELPQIVLIGCGQSVSLKKPPTNVATTTVHCSGGVHAAVIEYLLRKGVPGVFIATCPERNCTNREGPKWLHAHLYEGHESALRENVDRNRLQVGHYSFFDQHQLLSDLKAFSIKLSKMNQLKAESNVAINLECENQEVAK